MAVTCPACGTKVVPGSKFCRECGTRLGPEVVADEVRKLVTVLFADVTGSTALGERLDPEAVRGLMTRYFTVMRRVIERHGGTVEKFIGDAVMAVFGIPVVHEDDALRAVRAAAEIRDALARLNTDLKRERGIAIRFRTGLATGQVVAGDSQSATTLVTGDTVNTAARLEQAAPPDEILMGRLTYSLVRDAVVAEPVAPVHAKGKGAPVEAFRLVSVRTGAEGRTRFFDAPLVGRDRELTQLTDAWQAAVDGRTPHLMTLVAPAGVGKSRLVREFVERARRAGSLVLVGRCLPYGDGITYWPVREVVHQAAGITDADDLAGARSKLDAVLRGDPSAPAITTRIASAIGLSVEPAPQEEVFWAIRHLVEHLASRGPTVVVLEDLHWAEDTFLDLAEHVVQLASDLPLFLVATARPQLAERRPTAVADRAGATVLRLEPLGDDAAASFLAALPGGAAVPAALRARILQAAEGTPLYVEEFVGLLRDEGRLVRTPAGWVAATDIEDVPVPASIQGLLAARLDALPSAERSVAQRASVIGRSFEVDALAEIDAARTPSLVDRLHALVAKELLRPDRPDLTAGDAFRFRHVLIRDAAYEALSKAERAVMHERFAGWLVRAARDRLPELEEIVGYHLAQAHRLRTDLGESGPAIDELAARAAQAYRAAGTRADLRGDTSSTIALLGRAVELEPASTPETDRVRLVLAEALTGTGREREGLAMLEEVRRDAVARGDPVVEARAVTLEVLARAGLNEPGLRTPEFEELSAATWPVVERSGDDLALARYWYNQSAIDWDHERWEASLAAIERTVHHAEQAGSRRMAQYGWIALVNADMSGPTAVVDALARVDGMLADSSIDLEVKGELLQRRGILRAMHGEPDQGRADVDAGRKTLLEIGRWEAAALCTFELALLEGDEGYFDRELELIDAAAADLPHIAAACAAIRGLTLAKLGSLDAALIALEGAAGDPWDRTIRTRRIGLARVAAARGQVDEALRAADEVEAGVSASHWVNRLTDTLLELAVIASIAGDKRAAHRRATEAAHLARRKGNAQHLRAAQAVLAGDLRGV